ncbi:MAG: sugar phosphate isomerase/epimerase [Ktedonobacteraceae bacterium]|nr:sugar phosphate isomerase/epimerase [Ktedonobacteraceae bacterium]MBO0791357.1 sugar phosphate isomerase/epimerase [Ktedonobacteraceae bacterium]
MQLLCSNGAFSRGPDFTSHEAILTYGPQLTVDGFEVIFYPSWYAHQERIASELRASGLRFPAIHMEKRIGIAFGNADPDEQERGIDWFERNCAFAQQISAPLAVLHLWGWPESDNHFERNLQHLSHCLDIAERYAINLAIETIPCKRYDPLSNIRQAFERDPRTRIALDTEFLAFHDQIETVFAASWIWRERLVQHVHIKDFDGEPFPPGGRRYLHPGEGHIDFGRFLRRLQETGFDGTVSLESPAIDAQGHVHLERIQDSLQLIARLMD